LASSANSVQSHKASEERWYLLSKRSNRMTEDSQSLQSGGEPLPAEVAETDEIVTPTTSTSGRLQAFRQIGRELRENELANPGVQKLLLGEIDRVTTDCDNLRGYVERYHEADKRRAVLEEKLKTHTALDILFGVGVTVGGAIVGLTPYLSSKGISEGVALLLGFALIFGATMAKVVKR
jgi:hypothetical protein